MGKVISCFIIMCLLLSSGCTHRPVVEEPIDEVKETPEIIIQVTPRPTLTPTPVPTPTPTSIPAPIPTPEPTPEAPQEPSKTISVTGENRDVAATMIAKVLYGEARGIKSYTEIACVAWTILNRIDVGYNSTIYGAVTARYQFAYNASNPTVGDYEQDFLAIAHDVILRWEREHDGETNVGRVLPKDYLWFGGHSGHNWFRNVYDNFYNLWDYSLPSPYEN